PSKAILHARINEMGQVIVVSARSVVMSSEEAVLDFPKQVLTQPVEERDRDAVLLRAGAVGKTFVGIAGVVIIRAIVEILRLQVGGRAECVTAQEAGIPIIIFGVLHEIRCGARYLRGGSVRALDCVANAALEVKLGKRSPGNVLAEDMAGGTRAFNIV